jgi:uncharacterized coiled-coil protein SlyX
MTQSTETDSKELKDILTGMREEMRLGFADIKGEISTINTRLTEVEKKIDKLDTKMDKLETKFDAKIDKSDNRLWAFVAIVLAASLGTIYKLVAFP